MGYVLVCGALVVAMVVCEALRRWLADRPAARAARNRKARDAYAAAWFKTYPHELSDGTLVWYPVVHEVDDGCPLTRR